MRILSVHSTQSAERPTSSPRRRTAARVGVSLIAAAAVFGVSSSGAVASGGDSNGARAAAATAPTNHVELSTNTSLGKLVLTARGSAPASPVGLAFDNDSSLGQWKFISLDGQIKKGMYVLRHTENTSAPQCLNAGLSVSIRNCDSSAPGQRWTLTSGSTLKNEFERRILPPDNPILVTNLRMGVATGQPFTRTFTND